MTVQARNYIKSQGGFYILAQHIHCRLCKMYGKYVTSCIIVKAKFIVLKELGGVEAIVRMA
jgi:hypothetical protein